MGKEMSLSSNNTDTLKTEAACYPEPSESTSNIQEDIYLSSTHCESLILFTSAWNFVHWRNRTCSISESCTDSVWSFICHDACFLKVFGPVRWWTLLLGYQ